MQTHKLRSRLIGTGARLAIFAAMIMAAFVSSVTPAAAASVSIDLYAVTGTISLPGAPNTTVWGYNTANAAVAKPGGPTLVVNQGDSVSVVLHNQLGASTSLLFQGQSMIPDTAGVAAGGTKTYSFVASKPGTFLYEAGLMLGKQHQVAMGLYGALIVRPTGYASVPGRAYAGAASAFDSEHVLVLSELDTALNGSSNPATFDMRKYSPKYYLINGQPYPATPNLSVVAGNTVLLRYVDAGLQAHAMSTLGLSQLLVGNDGRAVSYPHSVVAETIAPGQTLDTLVFIPASAPNGTKYALYDASLFLRNNRGTAATSTAGLGGMLTFLTTSGATTGADTTGPLLSSLTLAPNPSNGATNVGLTFTANDTTTGNSNIATAEYWVDGNATHTSIAVSGSSAVANLAATIAAPFTHGTHVVSVRAQDAAGNWSATANLNLVADSMAPTTGGLTLTPNPSNGSTNVAFSFTGNDSGSGN
ncbi:MAG TPA: multicopper oxidase domain-containing protein, partial [Roseiflexaceae bacterium]|nr:multicopper oxidase domain-containing protein [Roseiflexaceae bacterium]